MTEDYYATLGVEPRSEAAAIRAAYLALMRRYHPDKNDSPAAIERAHAIIAAFKVLGDVEKRLHYDWGRRRAAEAAAQAPRARLGSLPRGLIAAAVALVVVVSILMPSPSTRDPIVAPTAPGANVERDPVPMPKKDAITPLAASAPIAATKAEPVVEEAPVAPQTTEPRPRVEARTLVPVLAKRIPLPRERPQARDAAKPKLVAAKASAKCRFARPGAEAAICDNDNLTALDRNVVTFYNQSLSFGAATKRAALLGARDAFLARREECRSDACLRNLHLAHLREMSAIVENRAPSANQ